MRAVVRVRRRRRRLVPACMDRRGRDSGAAKAGRERAGACYFIAACISVDLNGSKGLARHVSLLLNEEGDFVTSHLPPR